MSIELSAPVLSMKFLSANFTRYLRSARSALVSKFFCCFMLLCAVIKVVSCINVWFEFDQRLALVQW